nr:GDSL-type esterase/lipase family protein [Solimonas terrae]
MLRALTERLGRKFLAACRSGIDVIAQANGGGVVFLGDSLTHLGRFDLMFPRTMTRNLGIGGECSHHILARLDPVVRINPEKLFLLIGTNDLGSDVPASAIAANVGAILDRLKRELPGCTLHLQGLMPRQRKFAPRIQALNAAYERLAAERGIAYIDLYPSFDDGSGELVADYSYDRLHLSGAGYAIWRDLLRPFVEAP